MKRILALALFAAAPAFAQTPEVDAWKAAKQAELAAHTSTVNAAIAAQTDNTNRQLAIQAGIQDLSARVAALEVGSAEVLAMLKKLPPSATVQDVIDAFVARLAAKP